MQNVPNSHVLLSVLIVYGKDYDGIWSSSIPLLSFLINENVLGRRFRSCLSSDDPRISPLTSEYKCPQPSLLIITWYSQTNKTGPGPILLFHANVFMANARFEHSNFFTVNGGSDSHDDNKAPRSPHPQRRPPTRPAFRPTWDAHQRPTTSVLTATTLVYAYRAGITAAAGTRLALCWLLDKMFTVFSFQLENPLGPLLLFLVTTSRCPDWVICAPAAFLGCGSRFSGSLSGVPHPRSVTRQNHGKTIPYHPKLIGQKFERCVRHQKVTGSEK